MEAFGPTPTRLSETLKQNVDILLERNQSHD